MTRLKRIQCSSLFTREGICWGVHGHMPLFAMDVGARLMHQRACKPSIELVAACLLGLGREPEAKLHLCIAFPVSLPQCRAARTHSLIADFC